MALLRAIETYLKITGTAPSRFGRDAIGDPALVAELRRGRRLRPATCRRIQAFLAGSGEQG